MTKNRSTPMWVAVALLAASLALPPGSAGAALSGLNGAGMGSVLGCMVCGAGGLYAVFSGVGLATILWSIKSFGAGMACAGMCAAALSF